MAFDGMCSAASPRIQKQAANQAQPTYTTMHVRYMRRGMSDVLCFNLKIRVLFVHLRRLRASRLERADGWKVRAHSGGYKPAPCTEDTVYRPLKHKFFLISQIYRVIVRRTLQSFTGSRYEHLCEALPKRMATLFCSNQSQHGYYCLSSLTTAPSHVQSE